MQKTFGFTTQYPGIVHMPHLPFIDSIGENAKHRYHTYVDHHPLDAELIWSKLCEAIPHIHPNLSAAEIEAIVGKFGVRNILPTTKPPIALSTACIPELGRGGNAIRAKANH